MGRKKVLKINNYSRSDMLNDIHRSIQEIEEYKKSLTCGYYNSNYEDDEYYGSRYGCCGWMDDAYDEDDVDYKFSNAHQRRLEDLNEAFGFKNGKNKKKDKKKKDKQIKYNLDHGVYFYRDIENKETYEYFESLYDFDDFCEQEGITITDEECELLMRREVSHCCIDKVGSQILGYQVLISDYSYGGLRWAVAASDEELMNDFYS